MRAEFDEDKKLMADKSDLNALSGRFRGYYPVVIDVETAGFNAKTDALLEIAAVTLQMKYLPSIAAVTVSDCSWPTTSV